LEEASASGTLCTNNSIGLLTGDIFLHRIELYSNTKAVDTRVDLLMPQSAAVAESGNQ
jgi:hypothetical protein